MTKYKKALVEQLESIREVAGFVQDPPAYTLTVAELEREIKQAEKEAIKVMKEE